jgi:AraC-like DNA-binding protein
MIRKPIRYFAHHGGNHRDALAESEGDAGDDPEDPLEQVWAALINPKRAIGSIQILAKAHGYEDLVEFNREFRQRYGVSAREVRPAAKKRIRSGAAKR